MDGSRKTLKKAVLGSPQGLILDSILLGVVGALAAQLFTWLLQLAQNIFLEGISGYSPPGLPDAAGVLREVIGPHGLWLVPISLLAGGALSGLLVYTLAPEAEGHGTDTAVKAFHRAGGFIRARVAPIKMLASAITIGSGGAAGREGPTALISAGIGSMYAAVRWHSEEERRLLVLVGMAAGLSAIFRSPIGTAVFAIEVLYGEMDFEAGALLYTMLASIVAYVVNGAFVGWQPLFQIPADLGTLDVSAYGFFALLGVASGVLSAVIPSLFYGVRDGFHSLPVPPQVKPAIGALGVGVLAIFLPQILGGGYGWIQEAIDGRLSATLLVVLMAAKALAFALTVSSGGSGGVFAPTLFVGAMLGGFCAEIFHQSHAAFAVVGMAAVFGGAARVPMATLLMVTEMTGGYRLLVPAALAVFVSYLIQAGLTRRLKYRSLYEAQVPHEEDSPSHHIRHLRTALRLLADASLEVSGEVGQLELQRLLESGIGVEIRKGKQLAIGLIGEQSGWIGQRVPQWLLGDDPDVRLLVVLRAEKILAPDRGTDLKAGDRLLLIVSPKAWPRMEADLTRVAPRKR